MQAHLRSAAGRLLQQGLLRAEPLACSGSRLVQQRLASSVRRGRSRSSAGAAPRASWGLDATERKTERGGGKFGREGRGGGGGGWGRDEGGRRGGAGGWGRDDGGRRGGGGGGGGGGGRWGGGGGEQSEAPRRTSGWGSRDSRDDRRGGSFGTSGGGSGSSAGRWGERSGGTRREAAAPAREEFEFDWEEEEGREFGSQEDASRERRRGGGYGQREGRSSGFGRRERGAGYGGGRGRGRGEEEDGWQQQQQQPKAPTLREQWVGDYVYGVSPVLAALRAGRREVHTLYLQDGMQLAKRKDKAAIQAVKALAQQGGLSVVEAPKHELNLVTDNRPHQGLVLDCAPLEFEVLNSFPDPPPGGREANGAVPLWLVLDEVMDPQNFGAALRSAFFLGVSGVLTCHRNSAPLSGVVSKASAGAMELMAVHACKSMPQTLADAKRRGWQVLGAAAEENAVPCDSFALDRPTLLVVGNEGYGVRPVIKRLCDATLRIDGNGCGGGGDALGTLGGAAELVDSLNVSVATGILLHQLINSAPRQQQQE